MKSVIYKADIVQDKEGFLRFWKENFQGWPADKYKWFYEDNPYGTSSCWIARQNEADEIIGSAVFFPFFMSLDGKSVPVGITGDFGVMAKHRAFGPAIDLQKALITAAKAANLKFLYGFPNDHAKAPKIRAGFYKIGDAIRMVKILNVGSFVKRRVSNALLQKIVSGFISVFLNLFSKETFCRVNRNWRIEQPESFDERFDRLWEKASPQYHIIGERTVKFLTWRFANCPYLKYKIFALTDSTTSELLGYIIYREDNSQILISDLFYLKEKNILESLLTKFIRFSKKLKCDSVVFYYFGDSDVIQVFEKFRFFFRGDKRNVMIYADKESPESAGLFDQNNWHLLESDNDI